MTRSKSALLAGAALALVAGLAFSGSALAASTVHVKLTDSNVDAALVGDMGMNMGADMSKAVMFVTADVTTVPAGDVTFEVANEAKGFVHEMIVAKAPADGTVLPYDANTALVNEDAAGALGEVSELNPGKSGSVTLTLEPGTYVLFCNLKGHYMAGMWTTITVQ